jgi:DNA-binding response OmpR family regulator
MMTFEQHVVAGEPGGTSANRQASLAISYGRRSPLIAAGAQFPSAASSRPRIALFCEMRPGGPAIAEQLLADGYAVFQEESAEAFVEMVRDECFDLLVIGWELQSMQGMDVLKNVRSTASASSSARILVLTTRGSEFEVVKALESGADDCVLQTGRPFELIARVKALLRASRNAGENPSEPVRGFTFDQGSRIVQGNGIQVRLAPREFELARLLFRNFGKTISRMDLFAALWGGQGTLRTVDQHVVRVRRKMELIPEKGFALQAVYGVGYVLQPVVLPPSAATRQTKVS